jgi:hypothetical protein
MLTIVPFGLVFVLAAILVYISVIRDDGGEE